MIKNKSQQGNWEIQKIRVTRQLPEVSGSQSHLFENTKPVFTYVLGECVYHFPGLYRLSLAKMSHTNRQTNIYVVKIGISSDGRSPKVDFDNFFPL